MTLDNERLEEACMLKNIEVLEQRILLVIACVCVYTIHTHVCICVCLYVTHVCLKGNV